MPTDGCVHLIDDDGAVRESLGFVLESAGMACVTYDSAVAFLARGAMAPPACVVTDVRMPRINGLELVRRLRAEGLTAPVIVMTGHGDVPLAVEAMKAGACEFLEKPFDDAVFLQAVAQALGEWRRPTQDDADRQRFQAVLAGLSPREAEVLRGVADGKANKVIARDLGISPRTVEVYRAHVMAKTQAASLSELVRMALLAAF
ncbi:MAG: response regulator [Caulobacterales bacterium]|nr:response regulator [Caulobacterales bacterium]